MDSVKLPLYHCYSVSYTDIVTLLRQDVNTEDTQNVFHTLRMNVNSNHSSGPGIACSYFSYCDIVVIIVMCGILKQLMS